MNANNKAQDKKNEKLLNSFMEKMMGNFGAGSPSQGQAPAPKGNSMTVAPAVCSRAGKSVGSGELGSQKVFWPAESFCQNNAILQK